MISGKRLDQKRQKEKNGLRLEYDTIMKDKNRLLLLLQVQVQVQVP